MNEDLLILPAAASNTRTATHLRAIFKEVMILDVNDLRPKFQLSVMRDASSPSKFLTIFAHFHGGRHDCSAD